MAEPVRFTVLGDPVGKSRPRVTQRGTYTPAATRAHQVRVASAYHDAYPFRWDSPPTREDRKDWALAVTFHRETGHRRDLDNLAKLVMDALNGWVWWDDHQVSTLLARQTRVPRGSGRTEVLAIPLTPGNPLPWDLWQFITREDTPS